MPRIAVCKNADAALPQLEELTRNDKKFEKRNYSSVSALAQAMTAGEEFDLFLLDARGLEELIELRQKDDDRFFLIKTREGEVRLAFSTIICVESYYRMLAFHVEGSDALYSKSIRESFSTILAPLLEDKRFIRTRKFCVINMSKVASVKKKSIVMKNGMEINLPRYAYAEVRDKLHDYFKEHGVSC